MKLVLAAPCWYFLPLLAVLQACNGDILKPAGNEAELGERLFFDPILSRDSSVSCSSCHKPEFAFADNAPLSAGVFHRFGNRNAPTVMNQVDRNFYFWDGRAESLEEQASGPMEAMQEMDFPLSLTVRRLARSPYYYASFKAVYGMLPNKTLLAKAIAAYERTLETSDSPFDRYLRDDDSTALSPSARRGLEIFNTKGRCFDCHFGVDFNGNDQFRNIGLYNGKDLSDKGRFEITHQEKDLGAFKVPGLRNVAQTAPYMHNGMFASLEKVIDYYNDPDRVVSNAINRDTTFRRPLALTSQEKRDLLAFLESLSDARFAESKSQKMR